ncbi:Ppx/GppA phosphatase family protein [Paramicrobacterium chengjingii]|uniref:Ppx/GppA family phosphatase n=1 Tax=Paramicrobacterium chengjingii TaxID=2769067 RepID=A0ABX6YI82_9MICO|nr:Ppx/GppA phosphatase family protein [Microbacterium chengjingii]QPZ38512.1 Ppx/GppA family phosphatase [Microbacterium chengjingii]
MTRVAAIDCGTNSIRLLIADVVDGKLTDIVRTLEVVRLGQGVDRTGRFDDAALDRTLDATRDYAAQCQKHGVERVRFVATSATRDAANRLVFIDAVRDIIGVEPEVLSGTEEAEMSFRGATSVLPPGTGRLVVDLGGGSTELVLGDGDALSSYSMNVGCVRMTERNISNDPPTAQQRAGVVRDVNAAIDIAAESVDLDRVREIVGVAGTITTLTAHALGLDSYDPEAINGTRLSMQAMLDACDDLASMPREQRAALPYMHPGRVDVIAAGSLTWHTVLTRTVEAVSAAGSTLDSVVTSEHDILDGVALSLA